jgi:small-conductance mechanosensitive channel
MGDMAVQSATDRLIDTLNSAELTLGEFLAALVVLIIGVVIGRLAGRYIGKWFRRSETVPDVIAADVAAGVRWFIYLLAIGTAFAVMGVNVAWFGLAAIGALLVAVLVLRPQVENLAAGMVLTVRPAFTLGDVIEVERKVGSVVEIGSHSTAIETIEGKRFHMPNSELLGQTVTVYSAKETRRTEFDLALEPHTDLDHATSVITDALAKAPIIASDPAPDVVASKFDANAVRLTVRIWFPSNMISDAPALDAAIRATYAALEAAGIELDVVDISITGPPPTGPPPRGAEDV